VRVSLPTEEDGFKICPHEFCGVDSLLIIPSIDPKWNPDNLHFRSLIVSKRWKTVLSCGFKKFFNEGEKPDLYPNINQFNDVWAEAKQDGSLVIVDYCKDQFSMRTRGTVSYTFQQNSSDFELLPKLHPKVIEVVKENKHISFLFEIETPNNVIVVRPETIKFTFLGGVNKDNLNHLTNKETEQFSRLMEVPRPQQYEFNNLSDISALVKQWKGKEGIVLSYNNHQNRIKIKSDWYNLIHRIKSQLNSDNNLIDFYIDKEMPIQEEFYKLIENEFDFEIAKQLKAEIEKICNAGEKAKKYIDNILDVLHDIRKVETRKEQAAMIKRNYNENSSIVFSILDNKQITKPQWTKLIKQRL
jgi:rRNA-processing protein FCF1